MLSPNRTGARSHFLRGGLGLLFLAAGGAGSPLAAQEITLPLRPGSVRFAVVGDAGTGDRPSYQVAAQMARYHAKYPFTFVLLLGDNVYGSERPQDFEKKFSTPFAPLLEAKVEFYAALGNHDDRNQRFYKPFNMGGQRYYTFRKGNVRFFALDSNYLDPDQVTWLNQELAGSGSDWKIPFFHHPIYTTARRGPSVEARAVVEPLFLKYGASVVFAGHEHVYERLKPQQGIHYFTSGGGGKLRRGDTRPGPLTEKTFDTDRHFMLVEVTDQALYFQTISRTGETVDQGIIRLSAPRATVGPAAPAGNGSPPEAGRQSPGRPSLALPLRRGSVRFAVIGDAGTGDRPAYEVAAQMARYHARFPFTFVLLLGDNIYGSERPQDFERKFEIPFKPLLDAKVEFYAALGNHDDQNQKFYQPYNLGGKRYHTFRKGSVRFYVLDTNYLDGDQVTWLEKELAASGSDWKIPFFHHPIYTTAKRGPSRELRTILEPLFLTHGVNVVFAGHEHVYERLKPQQGVYYFTSGGGAKLRQGDTRSGPLTEKTFDTDRHFMLVEIAGPELHFQTVSRTGETVDRGAIHKPAGRPTAAPAGTTAPEAEP